jgi:hypothetical protein
VKASALAIAVKLSVHKRQLSDEPSALPNVRNVVVSGQSAFIAYCRKAALRSTDELTAGNDGSKLLSLCLESCG